MQPTVRFTSHVDTKHRLALESLLFFNARQERVLDGIVDVIEKFGSPQIVADGARMHVRVDGLTEVQSLFAVDAATGRPVGIAIYVRADLESITVLHLGIAEEFSAGGFRANEHLLLRLLGELRRCSRRLKGVRRLELLYLPKRGGRGRAVERKVPA